MVIYELSLNYRAVEEIDIAAVCGPKDLIAYMKGAFDWRLDQEQVWVVPLNGGNLPLGRFLVHLGTANCAPVSPRDVFRSCCIAGAVGVVLFHNHPSGSLSPSPEDIAITQVLARAGGVLQIPLLDHIIYVQRGMFHSIKASHPQVFLGALDES